MRVRFALAVLLTLACIGCVSDANLFVIPGDMNARNQEKATIHAVVKAFPQNQQNLIDTYLDQAEADQISSGKPGEDLTIAQILDKERAVKDAGGLPSQSQRVPAAVAQKTAQQQAKFASSINVVLTNKQAIQDNPGRVSSGDQVVLTFAIQNKGTKNIKSVSGVVNIINPSGATVRTLQLTTVTTIPVGKALEYQGTLDLNPGPEDQKFLDEPMTDFKTLFQAQRVRFTDGTSIAP